MFLSKAFSKIPISYLAKCRFSSYVRAFDKLESTQNYLDTKQPIFYCIFAKADWNPQCEAAEAKFNEIASKHPEYEFVKIDTGKDERSKRYYGVRAEPEFIVCCLGTEVTRHTGLKLDLLEDKLKKTVKMYNETEFIGASKKYEKFHERFMEEFNIFDKDFDAFNR